MDRKNTILIAFVLAALAGLFSGCLAGFGSGPVPDWVAAPPADTDQALLFVARGSIQASNVDDAASRAAGDLVGQLMSFWGLVGQRNEAIELAMSDFQAEILSLFLKEAEVEGVRVTARHYQKERTLGYGELFYLVSIDRTVLIERKSFFVSLYEPAMAKLYLKTRSAEKNLDGLRFYEASRDYFQAALIAREARPQGYSRIFIENLNQAGRLLDRMSVRIFSGDDQVGTMGGLFEAPFTVQVVDLVTGEGLSGVKVEAEYVALSSAGAVGLKRKILTADDEGRVFFYHPAPVQTGYGEVRFYIHYPEVARLQSLEPLLEEAGASFLLKQRVAGAVMTYTIESQARTIRTALWVEDLGADRKPTGEVRSGQALGEVLVSQGYDVVLLKSMPQIGTMGPDLVERFRRSYKDEFQRVILGQVKINNFSDSQELYRVKVSGELRVYDVAQGELVYSTSLDRTIRGRNRTSAAAAAYRSLGRALGDDLLRRMP